MRQWVFCLSVSKVKGRCLPSLHLYRSFPMFSTGITGRSIEQASNGPDGVVSSILNYLCFRAIQADILHNHLPHPIIVLYIIQASEHLSFSSWLVWTLFCVLFIPFTRKALEQILCCIITLHLPFSWLQRQFYPFVHVCLQFVFNAIGC